jgi:hypothetical protein
MEIPTERLFEFKVRGKDIVLTFCTEEDAWKSYYKIVNKIKENVVIPKF